MGSLNKYFESDPYFDVSIQLVSPASGEDGAGGRAPEDPKSFHSISFPSEWGDNREKVRQVFLFRFPFN